ncbi:MAG: hypothetical protein KME64_21980 [Scytonematopsis contorta HA4267-MV1]|jgi:type IV secretory pathway VirB2 component (pilin)|nr:hypothetical protein [Scytonematopsis contorta HA4267-MV1]
MSYSASYAPNSSFLSGIINNLKGWLPNLISSLAISVVGSILLTGFTSWLSFAFGVPLLPFFFIIL